MNNPHKYDILFDIIDRDNVQRISELLALIQTKKLITRVGYPVLVIHKRLCDDVDFKNDVHHIISDSYDIVQAVALLLCGYYGKRLNDTCYKNKNGKLVTVRTLCNREIYKLVDRKLNNGKTVSLEGLPVYKEPRTEMTVEKDYTETDKIIESLELNETFTTTLECRISGLSYPEIGRIVGRSQSTVWEYCRIIKEKYIAVYGTI